MAEREPPPPPQTAPANPDPQSSAGTQPARNSGTYIIQIPKDQIYRVPPPENAYLAERYRKPLTRRKRRCYSCCCGGRGSWCFWALLVLGLLLLIAAFVFYFLAKPSSPKFTVEHFRVAAATTHPVASRYTVDIAVRIAGAAIGFVSFGGGRAVLTYAGSSVASGKMPSFYQGPKGRGTITLDLSGAGYARLPAEIQKSMEGKRPSGAGNITLTLTMAFQLKRKLGPLETEARGAHVWCTVRVNTLAKGAVNVLNQSCRSEV